MALGKIQKFYIMVMSRQLIQNIKNAITGTSSQTQILNNLFKLKDLTCNSSYQTPLLEQKSFREFRDFLKNGYINLPLVSIKLEANDAKEVQEILLHQLNEAIISHIKYCKIEDFDENINTLIENKFDLNFQMQPENSPIHQKEQLSHEELNLLQTELSAQLGRSIQIGFNPDDIFCNTLFHTLVAQEMVEKIEIFFNILSNKNMIGLINWNAKDTEGKSIISLMIRVSNPISQIFSKYLIEQRYADNSSDNDGNNLLHIAAYLGRYELFNLIYKIQPELANAKNNKNLTPWEIINLPDNDWILSFEKILEDCAIDVNRDQNASCNDLHNQVTRFLNKNQCDRIEFLFGVDPEFYSWLIQNNYEEEDAFEAYSAQHLLVDNTDEPAPIAYISICDKELLSKLIATEENFLNNNSSYHVILINNPNLDEKGKLQELKKILNILKTRYLPLLVGQSLRQAGLAGIKYLKMTYNIPMITSSQQSQFSTTSALKQEIPSSSSEEEHDTKKMKPNTPPKSP